MTKQERQVKVNAAEKKLKPKNRSRKATVEWGCAIPKEGVRESPGEVVLEGMGKGVRM